MARGHGLSLTIHSVMHDDSGVYTCAVTRYSKQPTKPEFGDSVRLIVNGEALFSSHTILNLNKVVVISCAFAVGYSLRLV